VNASMLLRPGASRTTIAAPPTTIRFAAVGLGWVTTNRHIPWLGRTAGAQLVGVVDRRAERVDSMRARLNLPRGAVSSSADEVPWLDDIDAVTIGTSPATHHAVASGFLRRGKDVLLEKPLTMTIEESRDLLALASRNERVLGVVHNFQFARSVRRALRMLERGSLGSLREVWGLQLSNPRRRLPDWYEELPLGLFYDESPHFFYLMRRFLGDEIAVADATIVHRSGRQTPISIGAQLTGGVVPGRIDMHFEAPVSEWHLMVVGSRRLAIIDIFRDILVTLPNDGEHSARDILRTSAEAGVRHLVGAVTSGVLHASGRLAYGNDEVMRRFVASCRNRADPTSMSGKDGAAVVALQHAVLTMA
jgi:scyllo-inositol 2-dehydrogenase (NADP+)